MKTTVQIYAGLMLMTFLSFAFTNDKSKKTNNNEESIALIIYGKILNTEIPPKKIHFNLYEGNDLVVSGTLNKRGEFELPLYKDNSYVIEFSAKGFLPKRFYFKTNIPGQDGQLHTYGFATELISESSVQGSDIFTLDFPMAIVSYNKQSKNFDFDTKYSAEMKSEEKKAMNLTQTNSIAVIK